MGSSDVRGTFATVAPSTVIVRAGEGYGTGVLVGPNLVLTNHHVVAHAENVDLRRRATVEFGTFQDRHFALDGTEREAWVTAWMPEIDIAFLTVADVPPTATPIRIATEDPEVGEPVAALGFGSGGISLAIRSCSIESIGEYRREVVELLGFCSGEHADSQMCEEYRHGVQNQQGLVVLSGCGLSGGDSGGPLVTHAGELVGLNAFTRWDDRHQARSYHVHVREIRQPLAEAPATARTFLPDPFSVTGQRAFYDNDLDGVFDTILTENVSDDVASEWLDLDQNTMSFRESELDQRLAERSIDFELATFMDNTGTHAFYDSDDDGRLDLLVISREGQVRGVYQVAADGSVSPASGVSVSTVFSPQLFSSRVVSDRLTRILAHIPSGPEGTMAPLPAVLRHGNAHDLDGNGIPEAVWARVGHNYVLAIDGDENSFGSDFEQRFIDHSVDVEMSVTFSDSDNMIWVWYDRNADGQLETVLEGNNFGLTLRAFEVAGANVRPLPELYGTYAMRPELVPGSDRARAVLVEWSGNTDWLASDVGLGGFPHPLTQHRNARVEAGPNIRGWTNAIAHVASELGDTMMIDLDKDSFTGARRRALSDGLPAAVTSGAFDAEFAVLATRDFRYAWYDTDANGEWDTVIVHDRRRDSEWAFQRSGETWARAPQLDAGEVVRPALFTNARLRRAFTELAAQLFAEHAIEG